MTTLAQTRNAPMDLTSAGISLPAAKALAAWRQEPDWVGLLRTAAWEAWETIPMPTKSTEGWRRTDLRWLNLDSVRHAVDPVARVDDVSQLPRALGDQLVTSFEEGGLLVQQDAQTLFGEIQNALRDQGVIFTDLHTALREHPDLLRDHFMKLVPPRWQPGNPSNAGKFEALNAALFNGGVFVYVPPNTTVTLPMRSIFWNANPALSFFPRTVIVVDRGSRLVYVDEYRSVDAAAGAPLVFGSVVVEAYVRDGARLDYVTIQDWSLTTAAFITQRCQLGSDAYVNWVLVELGGAYSRSTADVLLEGKGTKADLLGLAFGEKTQVFDVHTYQDHRSPFTDTDQLYKTALRNRARLTYEGLINIRKGSYGSNGYQANKNLLLDDTAKADSIPMLEINDNDVRCTHSASVGPVDEEYVYYLMSRGIPRPDAERMIVEGHFAPVIDRIKIEQLQNRIRQAVARKIGER